MRSLHFINRDNLSIGQINDRIIGCYEKMAKHIDDGDTVYILRSAYAINSYINYLKLLQKKEEFKNYNNNEPLPTITY